MKVRREITVHAYIGTSNVVLKRKLGHIYVLMVSGHRLQMFI